jgi:hypothetical protein
MRMTRSALIASVLSVLLIFSVTGCSGKGTTPPPAQASGQTDSPQGSYEPRTNSGVDVLYFEESNPCECMAEVGVVIKNSVRTHFVKELQSGDLRFFVVHSDDWSNRSTFELFKNQPFDLFIVVFEDGRGVATPVYEFWSFMGDDEAVDLIVQARIQEHLAMVK